MIAATPAPPYYVVIFTSIKSANDRGYDAMSDRMVTLAQQQPGFLGIESAREQVGITVSYWTSLEAIRSWKANGDHLVAQESGRADWYSHYKIRIAKVERDYSFESD